MTRLHHTGPQGHGEAREIGANGGVSVGPRFALRPRVRASSLVLGLLVWLWASPAVAGGGFLPPTRVDVSPSSTLTNDGAHVGLHVLAGVHWASASPSWKTDFDVGIGYVYDRFAATDGPRSLALSSTSPPALEAEPWVGVHGTYLELARKAAGSRHRRHWLALRAEMLFGSVAGETRMGMGLTGRAAWELFATVKAGGGGGAILGAVAIGTYVEVGARQLPDGRGALLTTAGLSVRIPFIAAAN